MQIALKPEPFNTSYRRVPAALVKVWDADVIAAADQSFVDRPGRHRENVFDGDDEEFGIYRAILSRESVKDGREVVLHGSLSFTHGSWPLVRKRACAEGIIRSLLNVPLDHDPLHSFFTVGGVFHWVFPERARQE